VYERRGDRASALQHFQLAIQADPRSGFNYAFLADLQSRMGLSGEARKNVELADKNMPRGKWAAQVKSILSKVRRRLEEE
jgi:tetratricopeptide (TPR) repeat protein